MPKLEKWFIIDTKFDLSKPKSTHLMGVVYGHPVFKDGEFIQTSPVIRIDKDTITTKSGSRYVLGESDPDYEALYPDARKRLYEAMGVQ